MAITTYLEAFEARDKARRHLAGCEARLDDLRRHWSRENGYIVPLRRESFEAMLRAVPPEPGLGAGASSTQPDRSTR